MMKQLLLFILLTAPFNAQALNILSMNTEWFWDEMPPHEGQIAFGAVGHPPHTHEVELEAFAIAQIIKHNQADIVGLVEVEGQPVVERILAYLPGDWSIAFKKGRDGQTGQDVALLSRLKVIENTVTNFPDINGNYQNTHAKPSKVLGVGLLGQNGETYYVVVAHLISKRSNNDKKRAAQANAIQKAISLHSSSFTHMIVMGDMNDTPDSESLKQFLEANLNAVSSSSDYSYVYKGNKQLIDHILVSDTLYQGATFSTIDLGPISDHRAVMVSTQ